MNERRQIVRIPYKSKAIIVSTDSLDRVYGDVVNVSPLGLAMTVPEETPTLLKKDVIVATDTIIMYADIVREVAKPDGKKLIGLKARRFTGDVLQYLFSHITEEDKEEDKEEEA